MYFVAFKPSLQNTNRPTPLGPMHSQNMMELNFSKLAENIMDLLPLYLYTIYEGTWHHFSDQFGIHEKRQLAPTDQESSVSDYGTKLFDAFYFLLKDMAFAFLFENLSHIH